MTVLLDPEQAALHRDRLHRAAVGMTGNAHDADDLVQDTYEAVLRRPRPLSSSGNTRPYLRTALERQHVDAKRRLAREGQPVEIGEVPSLPAASGERPEERFQQAEMLAAVRALPLPQRGVVLAVDVAGLSYAEAATALGIPRGTVMSRLYRGRHAVVAALGRRTQPTGPGRAHAT